MHNRQALTPRMIWKSFCDYDLWPLYFIGITSVDFLCRSSSRSPPDAPSRILSFGLAAVPIKTYLQLSFRSLGFSTLMANLLTVPSTVISLFTLILVTVLSEAVNNRSFVCMAENIWLFPCFVALVALPTITPWQYFAVATIALSFPYVHAIQVRPRLHIRHLFVRADRFSCLAMTGRLVLDPSRQCPHTHRCRLIIQHVGPDLVDHRRQRLPGEL